MASEFERPNNKSEGGKITNCNKGEQVRLRTSAIAYGVV